MQERGTSKEQGFSLIEVLITVAIMAVVALEMASVFQTMNSSNANLQGKVGSLSLTSSLIQIIANPGNCKNHLSPLTSTYNSAAALSASGLPIGFVADDGVSTIIGPTGAGTPVPLPNYNISVKYLMFRQTNPNSTGVDPNTGGNLYQGALIVGLNKGTGGTQNSAGGTGLKDITVGTLNIAVDAGNNIIDCFSQPIQADIACASLGGSFYPSANPPCQLPYPCATGLVFMGYDTSQNPVCNTAATASVLNCAANQTIISLGAGLGYACH